METPEVSEIEKTKDEISLAIKKAVANPLSYQDYQNFIRAVRAGGVGGAKLIEKILEDNPFALVRLPCEVELLEYAYRQGVQEARLPSNQYEMRKKINHEQEHIKDAMKEGAKKEESEFGLLFMRHPRGKGEFTTFILMALVGGLSDEAVRRTAQRSSTPSRSDGIVARRGPEIIGYSNPNKELVVDKPKKIIQYKQK